MRGIW